MERLERILATLVVAAFALGSVAPTDALFTASTTSPANVLTTAPSSVWFGVTGTGTVICAGVNVQLTCDYGSRTRPSTTNARFSVGTKAAALAYAVAVVDSTGPVGISTIAAVRFLSTGNGAATIPAATNDTVVITMRLRAGTPRGVYTGWILLTEVATAMSVGIPLTVTVV